MKSVVVMQPTFMPWLGYFDLIDQADIFVFYNDVQFSKQSWQTRNRISTANGILMISIPTLKCELNTNINNVFLFSHKDWKKKFLKTLQLNFSKAKYFEDTYKWITKLLNSDFEKLQEFNIAFIKEISSILGITTKFINSSDLYLKNNNRVERLIEISEILKCQVYLSTTGSFDYLHNENAYLRFIDKNIQIHFHNYNPVSYETGNLPFEPYMSVIDSLFHCGFENTLSLIRSGRKPNLSFEEYKNLKINV